MSELLDQVLGEVEKEYRSTDKGKHWQAFCIRVLEPIMNSEEQPSLPYICEKVGIETESKASNMIITVKRRLRKVLEHHMQQFVESDSEIEQEICELLQIFSGNSA